MKFSLSKSYSKHAQGREQKTARRDASSACPHAVSSAVACTPLCGWMRLLRPAIRVESAPESYQSGYAPLKTRFKALHMIVNRWATEKHLEALELVLLALHLNPERTWRECFGGACAVYGARLPWLEPFDEVVPRVCIELTDLYLWTRRAKKRLRLLKMDFVRSVAYRLTRRWLAKHYAQTGRSLQGYTVPVTIYVLRSVQYFQGEHLYLARALKRIVQSLTPSASSPLRLEGLVLYWRPQHGLTIKLLHDLQLITTLSVDVIVDYGENDASSISALISEGIPIHSCGVERDMNTPLEVATVCQPTIIETIHFKRGDGAVARWPGNFLEEVLAPHSSPSPTTVIIDKQLGGGALSFLVNSIRSRRASESGQAPLKSLSVCICLETNAFIELLQLIGGHLECLSLRSLSDVQLSDAQIEAILSACPLLRCLEMRFSTMVTIQSIVRAYELGLCPSLDTLIFETPHNTDDAGVLALLRASNDPTSMVHRTLRDLEYKTWMQASSVSTDILQLLELNVTLRHVRMWMSRSVLSSYQDVLGRLEGQALSLAGAPLPLVKRLAFLSAAHGRLHADASRLVMEYSGGTIRRKVLFECNADVIRVGEWLH